MFSRWFVRLLDVFNPLSPSFLGFVSMSESYWFDMAGGSVEVATLAAIHYSSPLMILHVWISSLNGTRVKKKKNKSVRGSHDCKCPLLLTACSGLSVWRREKSGLKLMLTFGSTFSILFTRFRLNRRELLPVGIHTTTITTVSISVMMKLMKLHLFEIWIA